MDRTKVSPLPWKVVEVDPADVSGTPGIAVDIEDANGHVVAFEVNVGDAEFLLSKVNPPEVSGVAEEGEAPEVSSLR